VAIVISRNDPAYDEAFLAGASVAFGVFDGVHEGHRFIIGEAVASVTLGKFSASIGGDGASSLYETDMRRVVHRELVGSSLLYQGLR